MEKFLRIVLVGILVISGFGTLAINAEKTNSVNFENILQSLEIDLSNLKIADVDKDSVELFLGQEELYLMNPGQPMIPRIMKSFELPFGAYNIKVKAIPSEIVELKISKEIRYSPAPLPLSLDIIDNNIELKKDATVYQSNDYYPDDWYGFHVGCGLNGNAERVTHLTVNVFPIRYKPLSGTISFAQKIDLEISYETPEIDIFPDEPIYDMVIITPSKFKNQLQKFVTHKNSFGVDTIIKTTEEIYKEYTGRDKPEQIKYFIKDAIEDWGIKYVLLFGGLKTIIYAEGKDDKNQGSKWWHVPVRYSNFLWDGGVGFNFTSGEPNYLTDLYYSDIYKQGGGFDDWDSNGNGIFAEWSGSIRDDLDLYPDVAVGRLAVRNIFEARNVINKIINYEKQPADPSWFKRIIAISGDGFLDQEDWNICWDTNGLPDGAYIIHAQSSNPQGEFGPIDEIYITIDKSVQTNITFNHDDHLNDALSNGYPAPPIAEIVSISNGNTLGNTNYTYTPHDGQAYCNELYWWANISYIDGVLIIRGKNYDPKPYGNLTNLSVWITNEQGITIFSEDRTNMETYFEGEWVVGEKLLRGRGGALVYMPSDFETNSVFTSNGKWAVKQDVSDEFSKGYGLAYFSGHGSPGWWGDHYPGIPGNRGHGQIAGLGVCQVSRKFPFITSDPLPMEKLTNTNKLPVVCVGGCHNSMFNVSIIPTILNGFIQNWMHTYGTPCPECWGWYMVKMPDTGAIATIGNTGYGWGSEGDVCTIGTGDGWINTEFFRQYGEENQHILGIAFSQTIKSYINYHKALDLEYWRHDYGWDGVDEKTVQQWELLGDPSLMIGGYS
ncbi:MAG: peptidase C25 [Candidatus Thermoplasmatota archaeon]|nr:peptidase C25 [Candidatus Thermoplasmatota archaeon]